MMRTNRRPHFTLLELLVVFFIISFGIILTGVKVKGIYQEQRFLSETQQVLSHFAMAQDLMLMMDADVEVKFASSSKGDQIQMWLEIEKPIVESWARLIERKITLSAIHSLNYEGNNVRDLTLPFSFGRMSEGKLLLLEGKDLSDEKRQFEIVLLGYPNPFGSKMKGQEKELKSERSELLYPAEVYEKIYADKKGNKNSDS